MDKQKQYKTQLEALFEADRYCPICKKKITQKMWDSQIPLHLTLQHSLGGEIGQWGDDIFDVLICSNKCFDKLLKKARTLTEMELLLNLFLFKKASTFYKKTKGDNK